MKKLTPTQEALLKTAAGCDDRAIITDAGLEAVGMTPKTPKRRGRPKADKAKPAGKAPRKPRTNTKQAQMIAMLRRAKGATIEEMATELGWQHHTVRGAMAGALKKKLGLEIVSEKVDGRGRVYRIVE